MKEEVLNKPVENVDDSFKLEFTTAADFEICESAQEFIKQSKHALGVECGCILEESYRGLSHKMQLVLTHRFMHYLLYNDILSTGVKHADKLLEEIIAKIPKEIKYAVEMQCPTNYAKKMGIKIDYTVIN
jgi:hypothetical protein